MDRIHEMLKDAELMGRESLLTLSSSAARLPVYPEYLQVRVPDIIAASIVSHITTHLASDLLRLLTRCCDTPAPVPPFSTPGCS